MVAKVSKNNGILTLTIELDEETARRLNMAADSAPDVTVEGDRLFVSSQPTEARRGQVAKALKELDQQWGPVFKRLAE